MKFEILSTIVLLATSYGFLFPISSIQRTSVTVYGNGKYDGELWDDAAKQDVKSMYDPSQPRTETNFDPFVRDENGNECDSSGFFPGEGKYKDPIRPSVSFAEYLKSREAGNQ
eukprot:CAMPEP_0171462072 /NCGR_PEP_ID=MMETSP0945-20130129/6260_1 /TAXON_ID=109269 /ORGANISM="Vaucheria litorea, Strain CCMP2940" /LENGTH=112 /DNA_ID=CAMNT_0011988533 /DNA_START=13 /DNA_END=351 /DNA_ORIENTATION=-